MCLPACLARLSNLANRRDFLTLGGLGIVAACGGSGTPVAGAESSPRARSWTRVVDLTHPLDPEFPTFSGQPQIELKRLATLERDGWNYSEWRVHEHTGTHIDAPLHKASGPAADAIAPDALVGPLVVIDIRERAAANPDAELIVEDLRAWEASHGRLPDQAIVAMNSGWDALARSPRFRGADSEGRLHFPGFHREAAEFLLRERSVKGIVVDTLSLDHAATKDFPVHVAWLGSGRWGLECVANLGAVPAIGATMVVGSPKVRGASGGPSRVLALV